MTVEEVIAEVVAMLQREGRVSYRMLKRRFSLDDDYLEDLKAELIEAKRLAADEDGKVLVWTGASPVSSSTFQVSGSQPPDAPRSTLHAARADGERRQLTVQFIDLVGSTALSEQLDPEELRTVIQAYRETCATLIRRFEGHLAKYIGDGLLVYFGYPLAHEDDAQRAVRAGLDIVAALPQLNARLQSTLEAHRCAPLQVRIGVHTGLVVAGEMGVGDQPEPLGIVGETPNIAARLEGLAEPDTVVISRVTYRLVQGLFECQDRGSQELKGLSTPLPMYRVVREGAAQSRFEVAVTTGLTPLVGRAEELTLLQRRWEQAKQGAGQVVLLSGEPGIGKSRLVQEFKEQVAHEGVTRIEFRCSPYHQNSAFYPIIDHLQRLLQFARDDSLTTKLAKLQHTLSHYRFPQADTVPLLASLLSLPHPEGAPPITLSPQKQKQKTHEALVAWMLEEAEKAAVYFTWEDLHWADPSTLELLDLLIDQAPTARILTLLTFRPEFLPPWGNRSHLSQITLSRLERPQTQAMVEKVTGGKTLPAEVVQQIVVKTDGVPLFVEELTKSVMESGVTVGATHASSLQLAIPASLQDTLMARLDRLSTVREIAQLGATLGREFSYELLQAVSSLDEATLQHGLQQLVEAELVYQRGLVPQAHYLFKHALIQDTAYQSLLKSTRQQYHTQIARALEEQFPATKDAHPELLAHHYTEAGFIAQAIPYWQQAGQRAVARSANVEAVAHLTRGLELLKTLPDTPERAQQELTLQLALAMSLGITQGHAAPEMDAVFTRAIELCRQVGETPQLWPALVGAYSFYLWRAEYQTARELGERLISLAQRVQDSTLLLTAHFVVGQVFVVSGEWISARAHFEQALALYDPGQRRAVIARTGRDGGVASLPQLANVLWALGYPDQALTRSRAALTLVQEIAHPLTTVLVWLVGTWLHRCLHEVRTVQQRAEALITLCNEQGFSAFLALAIVHRGWALAMQGQKEEGIQQLQQGLAALRATGAELFRPYFLGLLAEAYGKAGQVEEGLTALAEALAAVDRTGERGREAELYRLKGELVSQSAVRSPQSEVKTSLGQVQDKPETSQDKSAVRSAESEAEECFQRAIEIARKQQAKSLELRATMSLARLWQQQGKHHAARNTLSEIYNWFTEGFDTKDLQEAKAPLNELEERSQEKL